VVYPVLEEDIMADLRKELEKKRQELQELVHSRSKANCADVYSSGIDVRRETRIEELEEEIDRLQEQLEVS
jgi:polyhydroxyalkanoate synthesis regulator phasin